MSRREFHCSEGASKSKTPFVPENDVVAGRQSKVPSAAPDSVTVQLAE